MKDTIKEVMPTPRTLETERVSTIWIVINTVSERIMEAKKTIMLIRIKSIQIIFFGRNMLVNLSYKNILEINFKFREHHPNKRKRISQLWGNAPIERLSITDLWSIHLNLFAVFLNFLGFLSFSSFFLLSTEVSKAAC